MLLILVFLKKFYFKGDITLCIRLAKLYIIATLTPIKAVKAKSPSEKGLMRGTGFEPANSCETGS